MKTLLSLILTILFAFLLNSQTIFDKEINGDGVGKVWPISQSKILLSVIDGESHRLALINTDGSTIMDQAYSYQIRHIEEITGDAILAAGNFHWCSCSSGDCFGGINVSKISCADTSINNIWFDGALANNIFSVNTGLEYDLQAQHYWVATDGLITQSDTSGLIIEQWTAQSLDFGTILYFKREINGNMTVIGSSENWDRLIFRTYDPNFIKTKQIAYPIQNWDISYSKINQCGDKGWLVYYSGNNFGTYLFINTEGEEIARVSGDNSQIGLYIPFDDGFIRVKGADLVLYDEHFGFIKNIDIGGLYGSDRNINNVVRINSNVVALAGSKLKYDAQYNSYYSVSFVAGMDWEQSVSTHDEVLSNEIENTLNAYPNPINSHVIFEDKGADIQNIEIFNPEGQSVFMKNDINGSKIDLPINLSSGVYICQVKDKSGKIRAKKVVVK